MGETTAKCFINGSEGNFSKARQWSHDEIVFAITLREHSHTTLDIFGSLLTYLLLQMILSLGAASDIFRLFLTNLPTLKI